MILVLTEAFFAQIFQSPAVPFFPRARLVSFGPGVLVGAAVAVAAGVLLVSATGSDASPTVSDKLFPEHPVSNNAVYKIRIL